MSTYCGAISSSPHMWNLSSAPPYVAASKLCRFRRDLLELIVRSRIHRNEGVVLWVCLADLDYGLYRLIRFAVKR
jgi:hypothetical protein